MPHNAEAKQLTELLAQLRKLHQQLLQAVQNKQRTMRQGDMDALKSWTAREEFVARQIAEVEGTRQQIVEALAATKRLPENVTVRQLAEHFVEPHRSSMLAMAGAIRTLARQAYQINQVNDAVTREMLACFDRINQKLLAPKRDSGLYDGRGQRRMVNNTGILDAVG